MELTEQARQEYAVNFAQAHVLPDWQGYVAEAVDTIARHIDTYKQVQAATSVPWYVVAVIHGMESGFNFYTHLHNGDSLSDYTWQVPAGRPHVGHEPPFTWLESAVDALKYDGSADQKDWSTEAMLYFFEAYNGFGYRSHPGHLSQYLWSGTTVNTPGRYVADGVWDDNASSKQVGCVAMLKELANRRLLGAPSSQAAVSWFDVQHNAVGAIVFTGYAGSKPVVQKVSTSSHEIANWLLSFPDHSILVAPANKPIPKVEDVVL